MGNLKEIRNRIGSVKNTRKITSAMSRIAAARLRRAQQALEASRPYGERMAAAVGEVLSELDDPSIHPMLAVRAHETVGIVVVTGDRGLCGGFNTNVVRAARRWIRQQRDQGVAVELFTVGRKGHGVLDRTHDVAFHCSSPTIATLVEVARDLGTRISGRFVAGRDGRPRLDAVHVIYNYFRNVISQEVRVTQLLPVVPTQPDAGLVRASGPHAVRLLEPGLVELLSELLPTALEAAIAQALFNSLAAEVAARRTAMDAATDNASELIRQLTLQYNRERQAAITKELMEIVGGAEALKG